MSISSAAVAVVQQVPEQSLHSGPQFAFRGERGGLVKLLWYDGQSLCLFFKFTSDRSGIHADEAQELRHRRRLRHLSPKSNMAKALAYGA
ncbi:MAG TPA: IS66 family insertion sequence element accessory protein TnpB [Novosphingobium sp.]|nr:IS66 family insertion sequence element accessory protein TnpB [Novosphingobium sp.]